MRSKSLIGIVVLVVIGIVIFVTYLNYVATQKQSLEHKIYQDQAFFMQKNVAAMIEEKKKATVAIALTLASNDTVQNLLSHTKESDKKLNQLISDFKKHTNYKNIWIHILDRHAHSVYRSWTDIHDDSFSTKRKDLRYVIEHKKILSLVGVDIFSLNIKGIVPLYDKNGDFIGLVEVISHFNSIAKGLKKLDVDSVVIATEKYSQYIKYPFTKIFIDDCYVANFDAPKVLQIYLAKRGIQHYCVSGMKIDNGYIITSFPLKDYESKTVGYYIMFKKTAVISRIGLDYFLFRWSVFAILLLMAVAGVINIILYYILRKQKRYYKRILDTSSNIVLINNKENIIYANKTFFKYMQQYKDIKEFTKNQSCICDYFVEEEGYLGKGEGSYAWLDTILEKSNTVTKVKMKIEEQIYYFTVSASLISEEKQHYSVIFSDITEQELYKRELEELTLQDPLTGIGNRRKFEKRLADEMARSCRYKEKLSLISFDLDYFKKVNDEYGHLKGDEVLKEYAKLVSSLLRDVDEVFRIGGEEFMIIAPHISKESASLLAEKLRKAIQNHRKIVPITASFGVAEYESCEDEDSLYRRVDHALYAAKNGGRNRVVVA